MGDILGLVGKRLGLGLIILLVISVIIFFMVELLPGDIAQAVLGQGATEENLRALRKEMGLDQPAIVRYLEWLAGAVTFDFGNSIVTGERVTALISERFMNTLFLAAYAAVIAVPFAIVLGVIVALLRNSIFDRVANVLTLTSISSPEFFLGYILILYFSVKWGMFPAISSLSADMTLGELLTRTFLPALTLVLVVMAIRSWRRSGRGEDAELDLSAASASLRPEDPRNAGSRLPDRIRDTDISLCARLPRLSCCLPRREPSRML